MMNENHVVFKKLPCSLILLLTILFLSHRGYAGKLDDFEKDVTKKRERGRVETYAEDDDSSMCFDLCFNTFLDMFAEMIRYWGGESLKHTQNYREPGKPLMSVLRMDAGYQNVESDIDAIDFRIQLGYGPFGFQYRTTHYDEAEPDDEMDIEQFHLLGRILFTRMLEMDLGGGILTMKGNNKNSGVSFTTPVRFYPKTFAGIEFKPVWSAIHGNMIQDYDLSIFYGWRYLSLYLGYRWCETDNESLNGPHFGVSFRY